MGQINLKDSFRYSKFLDNLMFSAQRYLGAKDYVTKTQEKHLKSKINKSVDDETIQLDKPYTVDFNPNDVINFYVELIKEREGIAEAIATAKKAMSTDYDKSILMNKKRQDFIYTLKQLDMIKASDRKSKGRDEMLSADGTAILPYGYDIEISTTIDFDRKDVKGLIKKLSAECDEVSAGLDHLEIDTVVEFTPSYDVNDSFEDIIIARKDA